MEEVMEVAAEAVAVVKAPMDQEDLQSHNSCNSQRKAAKVFQ